MQRRDFMLKAASLAVTGITVGACSTTATRTTTSNAANNPEKHRASINSGVDSTLDRLYSNVKGSRELVSKASGALIFPSVIAAGLVVGGQYGEGALREHGTTVGYYNIASVSVGLQIGAQSKAIIFLFMNQDAFNKFRNSDGWQVGADASVAVLRAGANGSIDASTVTGPVVAFVLTNTGLMANLTLEGTKITRLKI